MSRSGTPRDRHLGATARLDTGEVLARWSATAAQADRDAVHEALFAVLDGTAFRTYRMVQDVRNELYVIVEDDLVVRLRVHDTGGTTSFEVADIGTRAHLSSRRDGRQLP